MRMRWMDSSPPRNVAPNSRRTATTASRTPGIVGSPNRRRCAGLWRFESDREITVVAAAADPAALARWPVGTRTPIEDNTLAAVVHRSGRPARIDSYDNVAGAIAARVRAAVGVRAA